MIARLLKLMPLVVFICMTQMVSAQRWMENLGRGVIAFRTSNTQAFISWRILGTEPNDISFNLYRKTGSAAAVKLNSTPITGGTNWQDNGADFTKDNSYYVTAIVKGVEQKASASSLIKASTAVQTYPYLGIPLKAISSTATDYAVNFVWVGDLDGDGEYDFVVDRIPTVVGLSPKVEAYKRDGTFLWRMDAGPLGIDLNNIEGGATAISNGHWDGLTVYDLDNDGKAEVIIKTAKDFIFGDGSKMSSSDVTSQYVVVCNGMTGKPAANIKMPTDYVADGPLQSHFGIAYLDGINPSIIVKSKNRHNSDYFNHVMAAYDFKNGVLSQKWKFKRETVGADFHQIRTIDVDQDGKDDVCDGSFVVDENGKMLYNISIANHGDRFHITDMDPDRPGLEGFAIQQDNPTKLGTYYYDAKNGNVIRTYYTPEVADMARGNVGDYDANHKGFEYWSFNGMYTAQSTTKVVEDADVPWPNFRIWWNGDVLSDFLNETKIDSWVGGRLLTAYKMGAIEAERGAPMFYGDIMGDWREEVIYENSARTELQIFSTPIPSSVRLYTLAHNPAYRNCFTYKGYLQSNHVDYYLGDGMKTPPIPNIKLIGSDKCTSTIEASAATTRCEGEPLTLTATSGNTYQWIKDGVNISSGGTTQQYNPASSGSYTVKVTSASGCSATSSATIVTINKKTTWYADTDGDGKGDVNTSKLSCVQPAGYVTDNSDLCPSDINKTAPGQCGCGVAESVCLDCNNVKNGSAKLDDCDRCTGGTTGKIACISAGEAETDACSYDGTVDSNNLGFKGIGFINVPNAIGSEITFHVNAASAGMKTISFRYASGGTADRAAIITINGAALASNLSFPATGAFTTYKVVEFNLNLNEGMNIVQLLSATADGLANIDQVGYVSVGLSKGDCEEVITNVINKSEAELIKLYPNPSQSSFNITTSVPVNIEITDLNGKILKTYDNVINLEFGADLKPGVYFAKAQNKTYKFVKY